VTGIVDKVNSVSFSASGIDITHSTINSVQSLNFGGSSSLSGGSFTAPTNAYVFIVFTPTVSQNAFRAFISWRGNVQVGETMFGYNNSGTNGIGFYQSNRGTQSPSFTVTVGTSYIAAFSFNNTATSLAMNGALTPTNGTQSVPTIGTSPLYICFDPYTTTAVNIGEVIIYNTSSISTTDRRSIEGYLAQKWGLTASLPTGHPGLSQTLYTPGLVTKPRVFLTKQVYGGGGAPTGQLVRFFTSIPYPPVYVTGGLVFYVDAGNTASYPGSGSIWYDLSPSRLNVTLYGSPTYSSTNGGYIAFTPSSSQYGGTTVSYNTTLTRWTTEAWHYFTNVTAGNLAAIICKTYGGDVNFALGSPVGGAGGKNLAAAYYAGTWYNTSSTYTLPSVGWYHLVGTYDGTNLKLYVNNVLTQTQASSQTPGLGGGLIHLMRRWDTGDYWGGYLGIARVYNRALSESEISKNYAVSKDRFGLS
jgi:hypothetical protein